MPTRFPAFPHPQQARVRDDVIDDVRQSVRILLVRTPAGPLERRLALDPGDVARLADDLVSSAHVSLRSAFASSEESFAARAAHR
jgi:hypothetical protein